MDEPYLGVATVVAIGTFVLAQRRRLPAMALMYADTAGLSVFTVIGFRKGFHAPTCTASQSSWA